jgi:hypothetical protein
MVASYRQPVDYLHGTLSTPASIADTTLSGAGFAALPGDVHTATYYVPLVLHDPAQNVREVVWITGHTTGATTVTIVRAKEGTAARPWPAGTQWLCAPTASRDALGVIESDTRPPDAHVGYRAVEADTGLTVEQTYNAGYQPSIGVALPGDVGPLRDGNHPPGWATILIRAGHAGPLSTDASGRVVIPFRTPFPNACITGAVSSSEGTVFHGIYTIDSESAASLVATAWNVLGNTPYAHATVSVSYVAIGY